MKYFLVIFDRTHGQVLSNDEFSDRAGALRARFQAERKYPGSRNIEIVVLGAASRAALHKTHSRYFGSASELAKSGASKISARAEA